MVTGAGNSGRKLRWHERLRTLTQAKGGGRSDYLEPVATSLLLSLSVSIALPFLWGVGKSDCKTIHFYFPALEHWPGPENKKVTFYFDALCA